MNYEIPKSAEAPQRATIEYLVSNMILDCRRAMAEVVPDLTFTIKAVDVGDIQISVKGHTEEQRQYLEAINLRLFGRRSRGLYLVFRVCELGYVLDINGDMVEEHSNEFMLQFMDGTDFRPAGHDIEAGKKLNLLDETKKLVEQTVIRCLQLDSEAPPNHIQVYWGTVEPTDPDGSDGFVEFFSDVMLVSHRYFREGRKHKTRKDLFTMLLESRIEENELQTVAAVKSYLDGYHAIVWE